MSDDTNDLTEAWVAIWNGELDLIGRFVSPDFRSHAAPILGGAAADADGADSLAQWVDGIQNLFEDLHFTLDVGPIVDDPYLALRWKASGTYNGNLPNATAAPGTVVTFYGTDTLRVADHKIVEYWGNTDSLWFAQQLGFTAPPLA